ncbi:Thaumatin [Parasponia andersonii]|uniref:Thaumatin n=1 Tax=Parasponia andersonii TaxID=3476 RepID=A0A2P5BXI0_PARAD|nr:Thaumatin [Parasponia andersonii]
MATTATTPVRLLIHFFSFFLLLFAGATSAINFRLKNSCTYTIWPVLLSKPNSPQLPNPSTRFYLRPGEANMVFMSQPEWSGFLWARSLCSTVPDGNIFCVTGNNRENSTTLEPTLTATLVDFTITSVATDTQYKVTYSVSLMYGFNVPITVNPIGGIGSYCQATGCTLDLNKGCPDELRVVYGDECVGCNYYSSYADYFEGLCPHAHTSPYNDTSTFACVSADYYDITFCASKFPSTSPVGYETQNQELDKKNKPPKPMRLALKYMGGSISTVLLLVSFRLAVKFVRSRNNTMAEIQLSTSLKASNYLGPTR